MEKVLQILAVFFLLVLVIGYSIHSRESRFRDYYFFGQIALPLQGSTYWEFLSVPVLPGGEGGMAVDRENRLSFRGGQGGTGTDHVLLEASDDLTGNEIAMSCSPEEGADAILFDPEAAVVVLLQRRRRTEYHPAGVPRIL